LSIQPVVELRVNGAERAEVAMGTIIAAEWDFVGDGGFPVPEPLTNEDPSYESMRITREYAFGAPGTYFPALRVTAHRLGEVDNPHGRIMNLGRVCVVVGWQHSAGGCRKPICAPHAGREQLTDRRWAHGDQTNQGYPKDRQMNAVSIRDDRIALGEPT
jgi:hypothetical protein